MAEINVIKTKIDGLVIIEPSVFGDHRGYFMETYNEEEFHKAGLTMRFVQDNESKSCKGVLRGLHFQTKFSQGKLVRVTRGEVYDVAVDLRNGSPTYGQWVGVELSGDNHKQFWIPEGFAHGFVALEDNTQFLYKTTDYYAKDCEDALVWNDKDLAIEWPIKYDNLVLNQKDEHAREFKSRNR